MKKLIMGLTVLTGFALLIVSSCADKNSNEACLYETTQNLDKGNYDAVLASPCAEPTQLGSAWFGKAGYNITDVVNNLIDANNTNNTQTDLNIYMTGLVSKVTDTTFIYLDNAKIEYNKIPLTSTFYKDAQFYISLVDAVKGMSLIKIVIDVDGDGTLNDTCDANSNTVPDEVDATACALLISAGQTCSAGVNIINDTYPPYITIQGKTVTTYRGLTIQVVGGGPSGTCPSNNEYKRLLYFDTVGSIWVTATTTADTCQELSPDSNRSWPCPLESNLDLVSTLDTALDSSLSALSTAITGTTSTDVQQAITDIKADNCRTAPLQPGENPLDPATCTCSSAEVAAYLQTI